MQMSQRARRMERRNDRGKKSAGLNLVSLMDIFTILVFFLLVNSGQVETLPNAKDIKLPESIAEQKSRETVIVTVTITLLVAVRIRLRLWLIRQTLQQEREVFLRA